jgi:DNA-3-methyladenine glycosylase
MLARIVETEAYRKDPASHAHTKTERSALMYDTYGHVYVYLIYGMYNCVNFTTEKDDAGAVLIRAVEPIFNIKQMKSLRKTDNLYNLCSGPGKLCMALGIDKNLNGKKIGGELKIYDDGFKVNKIGRSGRVGITAATDLLWRFYIAENKFVSKIN